MAIQKPCNVCRFLTLLNLTVLNASVSRVTKSCWGKSGFVH